MKESKNETTNESSNGGGEALKDEVAQELKANKCDNEKWKERVIFFFNRTLGKVIVPTLS